MDSIRHRRLRFESAFTFPERAARFRREQDWSKEPLNWVIRSDLKPAPRRTGGLWAMRPARTLRVHSFLAHATCHPRRRRLERVLTVEVVAPGPSDRQSVLWGYFCGLPRFATINPRASAVQRSWLANLSASLRSGPGGHHAGKPQGVGREVVQSSLPSRRGVSLLMASESFPLPALVKVLDGRTLIGASLCPRSIALGPSKVPYASIARASRRCATIWSGTGLAMEYAEIAYRHERPVNQGPARWGNAQEPPPAYG